MPNKVRTYKSPRAPTKVANLTLSDETREKLEIPLYLLKSKASDWADVSNTVKNCFLHKKSKVFTFKKLYNIHLDAFQCLSKQTEYKEHTTGLKQYSARLYNYYKSNDVETEFRNVFKQEDNKTEISESRADAQVQLEIAANKMVSKEARKMGRLAEENQDSEDGIPNSQESGSSNTSDNSVSSTLTANYHPTRVLDYNMVESFTGHSTIEAPINLTSKWIANGLDILYSLHYFREISQKITPVKLSDMRLLAINYIFLFALDRDRSIIRYFDIFDVDDLDGEKAEKTIKQINKDLNLLEEKVDINPTIYSWVNKLSQESTSTTDWFDIQRITVPFLSTAVQNDDKIGMIAANMMHKIALNLCNRTPNIKLEDSYVHAIVSVIFECAFQSDPLLLYQWANGYLNKSDVYKPDFLVSVNHSKDRYDLLVVEVKPPSNANGNTVESDVTKIGKEMAWMLNVLIRQGVPDPVVGGILFEGLRMSTFKMDLKYSKTYRLIELSSNKLFDSLQGISVLPSIIAGVIQLKSIVKKTAIKAKKAALEKAEGILLEHSPPSSFMSQSQYNLRPVREKKSPK